MYSAGQRISLRGEDFVIRDITQHYDSTGFIITAEGLSELVKGRSFVFDSAIDTDIEAVNPEQTRLIPDYDTGYRKTKLYIETQLRNAASITPHISVGHKAAIDVADYQLTPALKALKLPRPRILIADTVGLGKTVEVGIMLAELMKRGRGKRILVLALKSILAQFQQDIWERFAIPLVRLDSLGIARLKARLPLNKNPFDFYDKTIISIDTLKNNAKFRHYIEKSHWDVIVIDECHTVANISSQRGDLANYLAGKCESLILTSATPHNGKRENFANLIKMIEPTAISSEGRFTKDDIKPYYVRRFKHDIAEENIRSQFRDREIIRIEAALDPPEEAFLKKLQSIRFRALADNKKNDLLFAISIFKAYMSSPEAARVSLMRRAEKLREAGGAQDPNLQQLHDLIGLADTVLEMNADSKYRALKEALVRMGWAGRAADDRIVLFAGRIDTLSYLHQRLSRDFDLPETRIATFSGSLSDTDQTAMIEDFGKQDSEVRILLCSDAGSQGVNLHHHCHRMINYDIPWSLITLEQRNGRIDRYGQTQTPCIYYLIGGSAVPALKTDLHIIDKLIEKEKVVHETLGDAGAIMNIYDAEGEEKEVEKAIIDQDEDFLERLQRKNEAFDLAALAFGSSTPATEDLPEERIKAPLSLYENDAACYYELIQHLLSNRQLTRQQVPVLEPGYAEFWFAGELTEILFDLPDEALPPVNGFFRLTADKQLVQQAIADARKKSNTWAGFQMMYDLHPIMRYLLTKMDASVDKGVAPVARLGDSLPENSSWFVLHGLVPNDLGQPVYSTFFVVGLDAEGALRSEPVPLEDFCQTYGITGQLYTREITQEHLDDLQLKLPDAIDFASAVYLPARQQELERSMEKKLRDYQQRLDSWKTASMAQLELDFADTPMNSFQERRRSLRAHRIDSITDRTSRFFRDFTSLSNEAVIKVIAAFYNRTES